MSYTTEIERIVRDRRIQFLLHFTQIINLPGIMTHGLLPRRELEKPIHTAYASAKHRLDDNDDAISISISRINEPMFASKRDKSGHFNWLILALAPEILWTHDCRFCWRNAARKEIKDHRGWLGGPWALDQMFSEHLGTRAGLPDSCPTDLEAEVQVLGNIAPKYVRAIAVNRPEIAVPVEQALVEIIGHPPPVVIETF